MRRRSPSLRRRSPRLEPKPRILIICEGKITEPSYFRGLRVEEQIRSIEILVDDAGGVPKTLVERAVSRKKQARKEAKVARDENLFYDQVWCVFDVDEHPKLREAVQQAAANGISLAVSNPCFELWLLLHFREQTAWIDRHILQRECRECLPKFEKEVDFPQLKDRVEEAITRAIALEKWQAERDCVGHNPSTTVHRLVTQINELSKSASLRKIDDTARLSRAR